MPNPRRAHCIFCEDIRHEMGNKLSFMGIFHSDMIIGCAPPSEMPIGIDIVVIVWVLSDADDCPEKAILRVLAPPDGKEVYRIVSTLPAVIQYFEGAKQAVGMAVLQIKPLLIYGEGFLEVWVDTGGSSVEIHSTLTRFGSCK
ncbi:MAG: hypothetical protein WCF85_13810, partial [Rhodospirillaceae bacterium]